jgi:hypothetical protein
MQRGALSSHRGVLGLCVDARVSGQKGERVGMVSATTHALCKPRGARGKKVHLTRAGDMATLHRISSGHLCFFPPCRVVSAAAVVFDVALSTSPSSFALLSSSPCSVHHTG